MPINWGNYFGLHELILYVVIALLIAAFGGGPLLRSLFNWLLKILGRGVSETTINVVTLDRQDRARDRVAMVGDRITMASDRANMAADRDAMADDRLNLTVAQAILSGQACLISDNCTKCGEEHGRSVQNQRDIAALEKAHNTDRDLFWKELKRIRGGITCITNGLLAKQIIDPHDLPRED